MSARLSRPGLGALAGALIGVFLGALLLVLLHTDQLASTNCHQIEAVKQEIRSTLQLQSRTLGRPGYPGYHYYRAHPAELRRTHSVIASELLTFRPGHC